MPTLTIYRFLSILCWFLVVWTSIELSLGNLQNSVECHNISSIASCLMSIEPAMQLLSGCQLEKLWVHFSVSSGFSAAFSGAQLFFNYSPRHCLEPFQFVMRTEWAICVPASRWGNTVLISTVLQRTLGKFLPAIRNFWFQMLNQTFVPPSVELHHYSLESYVCVSA